MHQVTGNDTRPCLWVPSGPASLRGSLHPSERARHSPQSPQVPLAWLRDEAHRSVLAWGHRVTTVQIFAREFKLGLTAT